jgi:predicted nuclease with RNAse H fold
MRTLGIDLAAQAPRTAACVLEWRDGRGTDNGKAPAVGVDDAELLTLLHEADRSGIDAPFGWPDAFRAAIEGWSERDTWEPTESFAHLRYRLTDLVRADGERPPLSVSSDLIAVTAMRCARVLSAHWRAWALPVDRIGGDVIEVYPAAALRIWKIETKGYKKPEATERRAAITHALADRAQLDLCADTLAACTKTDHALDALVCALIVRAHAIGETEPVDAEPAAQLAREGWIHRPIPGSLERLATA